MGLSCSRATSPHGYGRKERLIYIKLGEDAEKIETIRLTHESTIESVQKLLACMMNTSPENICVRDNEGTIIFLSNHVAENDRNSPYICDVFTKSTRMDESMKMTSSSFLDTTKDAAPRKKKEIRKTFPVYEFKKETFEYLKTPSFDVWKWNNSEMLNLVYHMFKELNILSELGINPELMEQYLLAVQATYRDNPFHNFRHAFCVTQMMYGLLHLVNLVDIFTTEELFCLLVACLCHDMDHPGFSNSYLINARTNLAMRYNDKSPLENHHASMCFQVMSKPECNVLVNTSNDMYRYLRSTIIRVILATDMVDHAAYVNDWKKINNNFDVDNAEERLVLMKLLIKCCDISNEIRPTQVSDRWLDRLLDEYFTQGDEEKAHGLPTLPFMDRTKTTRASAQVGFINFVLIPLFETLIPTFGQIVEDVMVKPLRLSLKRFQEIKAIEEKKIAESKQKADEHKGKTSAMD